MIRRLRWKIVAINMAMVTAVLLAVFVGVLVSSRAAVERTVNQRLMQVVQTGRYDASLPGEGSAAPCFVADVYPSGTVRLSGSSYYQLDDQDAMAEIVTACLEQGDSSGILRSYHLRYLRADGPLYTRIAFTDAAQEDATLRAVVKMCLLVGAAALAVLLGCSWLLAGLAARPVARSLDQQRRFLSDASHELKTPLAAIRLLTDSILQTDQMDMETVRDFVTDIGSEAERLSRITEDLLRLTRLDSGIQDAAYPVSVSRVLERVVRMLGVVAREKEVTLTYETDEDAVVRATEDDIHQILYNLMENGIKYSGSMGFVHTTLKTVGDTVVISVEDNGIGIPNEDMEHIFERFYRVDKNRSRAVGGTGLGLSIVSDTVRRRGGSIRAQHRQSGSGTVFIVELPLARREEADE